MFGPGPFKILKSNLGDINAILRKYEYHKQNWERQFAHWMIESENDLNSLEWEEHKIDFKEHAKELDMD